MAKRSVSYTMGGNPKNRMSNVLAGDDRTGGRGVKRNPSVVRVSDPANAVSGYGSGGLGTPVGRLKDYAPSKPLPAGSVDIRGYFGDERTGIRKAGVGPSRKAVSVAATAPIKTRVKPVETIRTFVREKLTPTRKTGPAMALSTRTGDTTGFRSGTKTGTTVTKPGVATKTAMSASQRAARNAFNKGGVAGPMPGGGRSSGGGSRSSGGANKSSGGGRGMTGGGGMGASGRGTGGKR